MLLVLGCSIDHIGVAIQTCEQLVQLFWRVLQVIIHRDDQLVLCSAQPAQERVVLPVVAHHVKATDP